MLSRLSDTINANKLRLTTNKFGLKALNGNTLNNFSENNRIFFILGSGSSINNLNEKQWNAIENGFSVGMNKWLIHDFIPNATSLEKNLYPILYEKLYNDPRLINSKLKYLFYPSVNVMQYSGFPYNFPCDIMSNIYLHSGSRNTQLRTKIQLDHLHNQENYLKIVKEKLKFGLNYEQKGSIYRLIQFALGSGFKKIVLCGIDLNNTKYFWDEGDYLRKRGIEKLEIVEQRDNKVHQTELPGESSLPISIILESLYKGLTKHGIRLMVSSKESKLAQFLPVWNGENL